jgi:hypothetical protein
MLTRTRAEDGSVISPGWHTPNVNITSPYVPHPLQLLGHIPMPVQSPQAMAGRSTPSLDALARMGHKLPFTFNGMFPG